jgi:hypothetical protein
MAFGRFYVLFARGIKSQKHHASGFFVYHIVAIKP